VRLSASFFMHDFLHSEIADFRGIPNIPDAPDLAIAAGRKLCEQLLEPLQATFGRLTEWLTKRTASERAITVRKAEPMVGWGLFEYYRFYWTPMQHSPPVGFTAIGEQGSEGSSSGANAGGNSGVRPAYPVRASAVSRTPQGSVRCDSRQPRAPASKPVK